MPTLTELMNQDPANDFNAASSRPLCAVLAEKLQDALRSKTAGNDISKVVLASIPDGMSEAAYRQSQDYKDIHEFCMRPEINKQVRIAAMGMSGDTCVVISLNRPYCFSPDAEIHLEKPQAFMGNAGFGSAV